jgi:hypothetical protein
MTNFLEETIQCLKNSGHTSDDIDFIGSNDGKFECTWPEFSMMADREYDGGYGAQEVASDLVIQFKDNVVMYRHDYDGSECWRWHDSIPRLENTKKVVALFSDDVGQVGWTTLKDMQEKDIIDYIR